MGLGIILIHDLKNVFHGWNFFSCDVGGHSRGLIMGWNENVILMNYFPIS
jgi:hypothetical protein